MEETVQPVSKSTRQRAVTAMAATCAVALAGGALAAGPAGAEYPAGWDGSRDTQTISKKGVKYKCKATNSVVNDAIGGPQQFLIDGRAKFEGSGKPGTKIRPKGIRLTLVMPKKLVKKVRRDLGVRKVRGSADVKFDVKAKPGGVTKMPVKGLRSGWKKLPRNKKLRIPTKGKADPYKIRKGTKKLSLLAPKRFRIHANLRPPAVGIVKKTDLNCRFNGKTRKLGNFEIR